MSRQIERYLVPARVLALLAITQVLIRPFGVAAVPSGPNSAPQSGRNLERPPTWMAVYDDGSAGERYYEVMRPGWHIHPGPAGIFWDPGRFAQGNYSVTSTIFLFPPGTGDPPSEVEAPYGLLLAGRDLDGPGADYVAFLMRNDGSFRVALVDVIGHHEIVPWTPSDTIATWSEGLEGTTKNVLVMDATEGSVTFWINGEQVAAIAREDLQIEGVVGLRVGDGLSIHVLNLAIGPNQR